MKKGFRSTMRKGFQMTFENGLTASVQWGAGNYCENHFPKDGDYSCSKDAVSRDAEVAVIKAGNDFKIRDRFMPIEQFLPEDASNDGTVAGYMSPEAVVDFLVNVKEWKPQ